jgi:C4-dicarboxylate-specific signal transduction histidine kinase
LVRDACGIINTAEHGRASIRIELDRGLPAVQGEAVQLEQVVVNLIRNGLDAMDGEARPELYVRTRNLGDAVELVVRDTGSGIDRDAEQRMFDPFFSTKKGGLGMGLAISRSIVEAHGGTIAFERNTERGTTFRVVVPFEGLAAQLSVRAPLRTRPTLA